MKYLLILILAGDTYGEPVTMTSQYVDHSHQCHAVGRQFVQQQKRRFRGARYQCIRID